MKKKIATLFSATMIGLSITACSKPSETQENLKQMEATLVSFAGSELDVKKEGKEYNFDVSKATIDTKNMRSGDDLIISYKGELKGTDTSKVEVVSIKDQGNNEENKEKEIIGTLVDATMNTITIKTNDGHKLTFNSNNCKHQIKNGLQQGNWIVVTYIGEINDEDTTNVKVTKITDNDENKVKKEQKAMKIKAVDETVYAKENVHIRALYNTESDILGILAQGESITRTGICENGWSRVNYNGQDAFIYGDYLSTRAPKKATKPSKPSANLPSPPAQGEVEQRVFGTVVDVSMSTLTVKIDEDIYTLNIMNAQHQYANGIQAGNTVKITYIGNLDDPNNTTVLKVEDEDPNTSASSAIYVGSIIDATMNTVSIKTADDMILTFETTSATNNVGSFTIGTTISITADASQSYITQSILTASEINAG